MKVVAINVLQERVISLARKRMIGATNEKLDASYTSVVAELAKRTRKSCQQIRTAARRRARAEVAV